ncbi:uncharacterized protein LOC142220056 [Haematobia irritans]|uniref:uncharacterized protein LOC142220056 n=1 Tax=Haematobia irritans TaxID=7368 RepID=UPI003F4FF939
MNLARSWLFLAIYFAFSGSRVDTYNSSLTSTLRTPVERIFSRRKRWLLFPKGSHLKFTVAVSKRLLAIHPKGLNFVLEAALYYPMPTARIDLIPKRFRKPTTKAPKVRGPTPLNLIGIPGSLIKYRAKPATRPPLVQRIDYNVSSLKWLPSTVANYSAVPPKWAKYNTPQYLHQYQWTPSKQEKYVQTYTNTKYPANKWYNWRRHYNKSNHWSRYGRNIEFDENEKNSQHYDEKEEEEWDNCEDASHYANYRSRRDLFGHFEGLTKILGIDMKSCIMRAMCDSKRFLMPPGYSLVHDIVRVIFKFPTVNGYEDDYSRIMKQDYETCDGFLRRKCPFSVLDLFLNSKRSL